MKELKTNIKMPAIAFTVLILGWFAYTTFSLKTKESRMIKKAKKYLVLQLEEWKNGGNPMIAHVMPTFASFTRAQWENVSLIDYKIKKIYSVTRRKRNYFNIGYRTKYKYVFDHIKAKVLLTLEDENGVESTEEATYRLYPKENGWIVY